MLALHLLFGLGVALTPPVGAPAGAHTPLVVVTELPTPPTNLSIGDMALDVTLSVPPPHPPMPAVPASPDPDAVIADASPADAAEVARICGAWAPQRGSRAAASLEPDVLVRVEQDGKVSDSRLRGSTGSVERDAALRHCLLTFARLTPISLEGHAVAAWQTLHPPRTASSRH